MLPFLQNIILHWNWATRFLYTQQMGVMSWLPWFAKETWQDMAVIAIVPPKWLALNLLRVERKSEKRDKTTSNIETTVGGGIKHFLFLSLLGEMIQFDEHIFQMGGSTTIQRLPLVFLLKAFVPLDRSAKKLSNEGIRTLTGEYPWRLHHFNIEQWKKGPWLFRVYRGWHFLPSYVGDYNKPL